MPTSTVEESLKEFKRCVRDESLDDLVKNQMFGGEPYVFRDRPESMDILRQHIASGLKVSGDAITIVGSAKLGFSASPDTFARAFTEESDIDVIVVSPALFDSVWYSALEWSLPQRGQRILNSDFRWRGQRMEDIFWGWLTPKDISFDRIPYKALEPIRALKTTWFNTFRSLARYSQFSKRDVNGRLYRTWEHATMYHVDGLRRLQRVL